MRINSIIDEISWLGKKEELAFRQRKFQGKNAVKIYKYANHVDGLIRTRAIILTLAIMTFFPVALDYFEANTMSIETRHEKSIFASMLLISGLIFNKFRIVALLLALMTALLTTASYALVPENFHFGQIAYSMAMLIFIVSGFYYHHKAKKIESELRQDLLKIN